MKKFERFVYPYAFSPLALVESAFEQNLFFIDVEKVHRSGDGLGGAYELYFHFQIRMISFKYIPPSLLIQD